MGRERNQKSFSNALVEAAVDGIITIDAKSKIITFNTAAERIFGYRSDEVIGKNVSMLMPEPFRSEHDGYVDNYLKTGQAKIIGVGGREVPGVRKDGSTFVIGLAVNEFFLEGKRAFVGIVRDVSELVASRKYLTTQYMVTKTLAERPTLEEAFKSVLTTFGKQMGWPYGCVWLLDEVGEVMQCAAAWSDHTIKTDEFVRICKETTFRPGAGIVGKVLKTKASIWVNDVTENSSFTRSQAVAKEGLRSAVFIPICNNQEALGVIEFFSRNVLESDKDLLEAAETIGIQVGQFLDRERAELEAERLKDQLVALVSHELRTPLTSIVGYLELLEKEIESDRASTDDIWSFLEIIKRNTLRLQHLIGDLLFTAQVDEGHLSMDMKSADLKTIVSESVKAAQHRANEAGLDIQYELADVPPVKGDASRLGQVLDNLISNAIKYTPANGIINVTLDSETDHATISVRDNGPGISREEQKHLFDRFYRASTANTSIQGVGLGLPIAKAIVKSHGGSIAVESEQGKGTTVKVCIPLDKTVVKGLTQEVQN